MEILSNLSHLLASSRPPRSLSALLTGQLWKRLNIRVLDPGVLGLAGGGPGVVSVGVGLPVHAALLPPLAPVEHPEVARRTQRRVRVVLALQTLVTRLMGKIFLYYIKLFLKYQCFVLYLRDVSVRHDASLLLRGGALIGGVCGYRGAHHPATSQTLQSVILISQP